MDEIRIIEVYRTRTCFNITSGHRWTEHYGGVTAYEVAGGGFIRTKHRTLKGAEAEAARRRSMREKFPEYFL